MADPAILPRRGVTIVGILNTTPDSFSDGGRFVGEGDEVDVEAAKRGLTRYAPLGIALALFMAIELINVIWLRSQLPEGAGGFVPTPEGYSNTEALCAVLYTEHVYAFEIAAVILLLAIIAAITLTMRKRPGLKVQNISKQVATRAKDRIRVVKMDAEKKQ